ncbi:MAG: hypothetical protein KTR23_03345 [Rhodospirillales bacterium]|nr:hypothetical protein [Rhodospirillales bacterium]
MHSCDTHPARRYGEVNFSDPGRDWGKASHIVPGRRKNEPNHKAWHSPVSLVVSSPSGFSLVEEAHATPHEADKPDPYEEMARAMVKTIGDSVDVLKSIAEIMPVLERVLFDRDREIHPDISDQDHKEKARRKAAEEAMHSDAALTWSPDMMVELHNLCAQNRKSVPAHLNAINKYGRDAEPENDILPPLRHLKD